MSTGSDDLCEQNRLQYDLIAAEPDYQAGLAAFGQKPFVYDVIPEREEPPKPNLPPLHATIAIGDMAVRLVTDRRQALVPYMSEKVRGILAPEQFDLVGRARRDITRIIVDAGNPEKTWNELLDTLPAWDEARYPRRLVWARTYIWLCDKLKVGTIQVVQFKKRWGHAHVNPRLVLRQVPFDDAE